MSMAEIEHSDSESGDVTETLTAQAIIDVVRRAGDGAADPKSAKLARQARAGQLDLVGAMALIPAGSPDGQTLRRELRELGIPAKQIDASIAWYRRQRAGGKGWEERLLRNDRGELESVTANAITILRNDPAWADVLAWDDFAQAIVFRSPPPWCHDDRPAVETGALDDYNAPALGAWLSRMYRLKLSDEAVYKAARTVAMGPGRRFDSLRDWLTELTWDGQSRVGGGDRVSWLTTYLGVPDSPYARFVGRAWLVSAVARGMVPGCQVDHVLIAEGDQEIGKSSAFRILCGERFSDSALPLHDKDRFVNLRAVHVYSFDELASLGRADQNVVKNFLTARVDIFRPPYGRDPVKVPRRQVFCGTVNPPPGVGYLKDPTGGRRFWPVKCGASGQIDTVALSAIAAQLWAEAKEMYDSGVKWHPQTREEKALCNAEQQERREHDVWEERVKDYIDSTGRFARDDGGQDEYATSVPRAPLQQVTVDAVLHQALAVPARDQGQVQQNRIAAIMSSLGWTHRRSTVDGVRAWRYHRPPPATLEALLASHQHEAARLRAEAARHDEHAARVALELEAARAAAAAGQA